MTTQISALIADRLVLKLQADLIADNSIEAERVGVVRYGNLQQNPEKVRIYVLVHCGRDPEDDNWKDISVAYQEQQLERRQIWTPAFEVGGGSMWFRRGVVEWGYYGTKDKSSRDTARDIAFAIQGKIERAIAQCDVGGIQDDFGEVAVDIRPVWSNPDAGGGPPASFLWRGKIGYQAQTQRPY